MAENFADSSNLKSAALMDMMRGHLTTEEGKKLKEKVGLVYQINVAPKKIGFQEESFVVDLKNLKVYKGKFWSFFMQKVDRFHEMNICNSAGSRLLLVENYSVSAYWNV